MAKLPKQQRDAIRHEGRAEREPFRPSSQNRFMSPNLEEIYREESSAGKVNGRGHTAHQVCRPLEYSVVKTEGI